MSKHILGEKNFFPPRNTKTLRQISMYSGRMSVEGGVWLKNSMCLNGLKWLKTHFKTMFVFYKKVWIWGWPPPSVEKIHTFYFFLKASLMPFVHIVCSNSQRFQHLNNHWKVWLPSPITVCLAYLRNMVQVKGLDPHFVFRCSPAWFACLAVCPNINSIWRENNLQKRKLFGTDLS